MTLNSPGKINLTEYDFDAHLPLVSTIVVNYNQGRFLEEAVTSIMNQTYRNVECILVDDKSTDESSLIIDLLMHKFPQIRCVRRDQNGGQTAASFSGLAASRGSFIHFLDADDYVTRDFIEAHVYTHLSARISVGFTCSDMFERHGDEILAFGNINIARYRSSIQCVTAAIKTIPNVAEVLGCDIRNVAPEAILDVAAWHRGWPWSASSAFVYRRAALEIFTAPGASKYPRHSTDTLLAYAINSMTGSLIIDEPLAFYRCHGANVHAARVPMNHVIGFERSKMLSNTAEVIECILDVTFNEPSRFKDYFWKSGYFFNVTGSIIKNHPRPFHVVKSMMWRRRKSVTRAFGKTATFFGYLRILSIVFGGPRIGHARRKST